MSTPTNLFVESHLYAFIDESGYRDLELEAWLAELEGQASVLIDKIVEAARWQRTPKLSQAEKKVWSLYSYVQWKRVPDVRKKIEVDVVSDDWVSQVVKDLGGTKDVSVLIGNAWVTSIPNPGHTVQSVLLGKELGIVVVKDPGARFIIGSNPIVKLSHPGRAHLSDPTVELWFPIASDVAVSPFAGESEKLVLGNANAVHAINEAISKQSSVIAGCSREQIASLSGICAYI